MKVQRVKTTTESESVVIVLRPGDHAKVQQTGDVMTMLLWAPEESFPEETVLMADGVRIEVRR